MTSPVWDVVGWGGAALLLVAYALLTRGHLVATSPTYLALNLGGSVGLATHAALQAAWPSTVVNILWLVIGLAALRRPSVDPRPTGRSGGGRVVAYSEGG